jgi:hypothetical protein
MSAKDAPAQCFNRGTRLPGPEPVRGLVRELRWPQGQLQPPGAAAPRDCDAALEHAPQI